MSLYLLLDLGSIFIPLLFSFHPKIRFDQKFRYFIPAMLLSAVIFISWDVIFTLKGYWGFNADYLMGLHIWHLPIEEFLFFICIPFACVFMFYSIKKLAPSFAVGDGTARIITRSLLLLIAVTVALNIDKPYTAVNGISTFLILLFTSYYAPKTLNHFYPIFLVMLVPFFLINGVLTGSFIAEEIVWYNNDTNLGIRMFTIPVEDTFYALGLILLNIFFTEQFERSAAPFSLSTLVRNIIAQFQSVLQRL